MNHNNILFFLENTNHYYFDDIDDCDIFYVSRHGLSSHFFLRMVWYLIRKKPNSLFSRIASEKIMKKRFSKSDFDRIQAFRYLCLFDSAITPDLLVYLKLVLKKEICVYFWNQTNKSYINYVKKILPKRLLFSYSAEDSKTFNLNYLSMPYEKIYNINKQDHPSVDFYFFGKDKGRLEYIINLCKTLSDAGFSCYADVVTDEKKLEAKEFHHITLRNSMCNYHEYLQSVMNAKCIIELITKENPNLTIRYLESSFYGIKLLTNNAGIINEPIYSANNVFLFNSQIDTMKLKGFIDEPFIPIDETILNQYRLSSFKKRIISSFEK